MEGILKFNLDDFEERKEHQWAIDGRKAHNVLQEISQDLFRPFNKHGYRGNHKIEAILDKHKDNEEVISVIQDLVWEMHGEFWNIINNAGVETE